MRASDISLPNKAFSCSVAKKNGHKIRLNGRSLEP